MNVLETIRLRRSIRKYRDEQIPTEALQQILDAGAYAPNAGGGQRTILCGIQNQALVERLGALNLVRFDRSRLGRELCLPGTTRQHRRSDHPEWLLRRAHCVRDLCPGAVSIQCSGCLLLCGEHGAGRL